MTDSIMKKHSGPVRAVTFDFWSTLYLDNEEDLFQERGKILGEVLSKYGVQMSLQDLRGAFEHSFAIFRKQWLDHHRTLDATQILENIFAFFSLEPSEGDFSDTVREMSELSFKILPQPVPCARQALENLRRIVPDMKFAVISDTGFTPGSTLRRIMREHSLEDFFQHMTFSDELNCSKPSRRSFMATLEALEVSPEEAIHVGDIEQTDIKGALGAGMSAILYTGGKKRVYSSSNADYIIPSLDLIAEIVSRRNGLVQRDLPIY